MRYQRLGSTGLVVSCLGLGCGNFGGIGSAPALFGLGESEAAAAALLDRARDAGINLLDTADAYGGGRSETYLGNWLAARGPAVRDQLVITSKVYNPVGPGPNQRGLSRLHVQRQIDASLRRLRTDRIDLYLIHEPDPDTAIEDTLRALDDAVRAGKLVYVGASNIEAWRLAVARGVSDLHRLARFEVVQNSYSLLDRAAERELLPLCADQRIAFTAFSPLAGGWLTGKYRSTDYPEGSRMTLRPEPYLHLTTDRVFRGLDALTAAARERGASVDALALAWVLHRPELAAAILGPRTPAHLDTALTAIDLALSDAEAAALAALF
ncbi:MAG TPA: aldo/keto reductase [Kofleriaceae bacterium]|jgi:aryl-alcohol dehydrogenase-like predicted oxidoreductase|nr:aldo/keto reductase [Kofleriaceae bacterium]